MVMFVWVSIRSLLDVPWVVLVGGWFETHDSITFALKCHLGIEKYGEKGGISAFAVLANQIWSTLRGVASMVVRIYYGHLMIFLELILDDGDYLWGFDRLAASSASRAVVVHILACASTHVAAVVAVAVAVAVVVLADVGVGTVVVIGGGDGGLLLLSLRP